MINNKKINKYDINKRVKKILEFCRNKKVLNIGCADNYYLHAKISEIAKDLVGIDINRGSLNSLKEDGYKVFEMDAENIQIDETFDIIVMGEVIEHVNNVGNVLNSVSKLMNKDSVLILTTPNIACLLLYFNVVILGKDQAPDHVYYFDIKTIDRLIERYNLRINEKIYIPPEIKMLGNNILSKIVYFIATVIENIIYLFSKRLGGSILFLTIRKNYHGK